MRTRDNQRNQGLQTIHRYAGSFETIFFVFILEILNLKSSFGILSKILCKETKEGHHHRSYILQSEILWIWMKKESVKEKEDLNAISFLQSLKSLKYSVGGMTCEWRDLIESQFTSKNCWLKEERESVNFQESCSNLESWCPIFSHLKSWITKETCRWPWTGSPSAARISALEYLDNTFGEHRKMGSAQTHRDIHRR